jgi:putative SOS response-associated peptidase YedK
MWGLIPHDARQRPDITPIHARAETLNEKPIFRDAYRRRRGVVAVEAFEQKDGSGKRHVIQRADGEPMAIAAIWDNWKNPQTNLWERTFATITVAANTDVALIHDRMPLILEKPDLGRWLGVEDDPRDLLQPSHDGVLVIRAFGNKRLRRS